MNGIRHPLGTRNLLAAMICLGMSVPAAWPQGAPALPDTGMPRALGAVSGVGTIEGVAYLGGSFLHVAEAPAHWARVDLTSGQSTGGVVPLFDREITAAAPDGAGGWFVGGTFTKVDGQARAGLAHILGNGSLDPQWSPTVAAQPLAIGPILIRALAVAGNAVIIGGDFGTVNGQVRTGLAALDAQTGALLPVAVTLPTMPFVAVTVNALATNGSSVYFAGNFLSVNGVSRQNAAAVDLNTGLLLPWDPAAGGPVAMVQHVAAVPGGILVGGTFTTAGGLARANVALVDPLAGNAVPGWNPGTDAAVAASLVDGSTLYLGGEFAQVGGMPRSQVAALDVGTGALLPWSPAAFGAAPGTILEVDSLAATSTTLFCGGVFSSVAAQSRNQIVALDRTTGQPTSWDPAPAPGLLVNSPTISALHVSGSELFMAGGFQGLAAVPRQGLAAIDVVNRTILPWSPTINGTVRDFVFLDDTVYICGSFSAVQGQPRTGIAALSRSTGALLPWDPAPNTTPFFGVTALATDGNVIYAGGMFTAIGGQPRNYIAALDPVTGLATAWDPSADSLVNEIAVAGTTVLAGGLFANIGGQPRSSLAALDSMTGLATAWNPGSNAPVESLHVSGGTVYVGGTFTIIGGQVRLGAAEIDLLNGQATAWAPTLFASSPFNLFIITSFAPVGPFVYVGGTFQITSSLFPNPTNLIETARSSGAQTPWTPGPPGSITGLALIGDRLVVAGSNVLAPGSALGVFDLVSVATVLDLAPPCTTATAPRLDSTLSIFGTTKVYTLSQAPPLAAATLFVSLEPPPGPPTMLGGCPIFLDLPSTVILTSFTTTATGTFSVPVAIPVAPSLADIRFRAVAAVQESGGALGGLFQLSNTLELTIGF